MIDIESRVAESLHARADREVALDVLRAGALARAGTIRRRRTFATGAGVAGLAAVVTAGILAMPRLDPSGGDREPTGDPAATAAPAAVGIDPALLHFDLAVGELDAGDSDWRSGPGYEGVTVTNPGGSTRLDVYIGANAATLEAARPAPGPTVELADGTTQPLYEESAEEPTTVDGRPGKLQRVSPSDLDELEDPASLPPGAAISGILLQQPLDIPTWVLRWQPVDGLHAIVQVHDDDRDRVYEAAGALRLDRVQRCAMPLRLAAGVVDAEWTECRTALRPDPAGDGVTWLLSSITLTRPGGDEVLVYVEAAELAGHPADPPITPNRTVAGLPAWWSTDNPAGLYLPEFGPASVFVSGTGEAEAAALVENLAVVGELDRPETWPERAVG